jgi:hypothetical protein
MNNVATYQDAATAWMTSDGMLSWVTSSVYERFAGGGYMSGVKLVRGFAEPNKNKEKEEQSSTKTSEEIQNDKEQRSLKRRSAPPGATTTSLTPLESYKNKASARLESQRATLHRQLSSLLEGEVRDKGKAEEELRKREEQEIQDDYNAQAGETQGRDIAHLVLVTHGIGQLMGLKYVQFLCTVSIMANSSSFLQV